MKTANLYKKVCSADVIERAWRAVCENGRQSQSRETQREIELFSEDSWIKLRSLRYRLSRRLYRFPPARGVAIPRPGKDPRPLVVADVESRIVQRAILDVLTDVAELRPYFSNPYSFGGIRRQKGTFIAGVPAAIDAVIRALGRGMQFAVYIDIKSFFTQIPIDYVNNIVGGIISHDRNFLNLYMEAVTCELHNAEKLKSEGTLKFFPSDSTGVAQGNSLSLMIGNILLSSFDEAMNEGDCACFRYVDDILILAPTMKAAVARYKLATKLLKGANLAPSESKTKPEPVEVKNGIEFLGISLHSGLIRPGRGAVASIKSKIQLEIVSSLNQIRRFLKEGHDLDQRHTMIETLNRVSRMYNGWGKHYWFCNDKRTLSHIDDEIYRMTIAYYRRFEKISMRIPDEAVKTIFGTPRVACSQAKPFDWTIGAGIVVEESPPLTPRGATKTRSSRTAPRPARSSARPRAAGG